MRRRAAGRGSPVRGTMRRRGWHIGTIATMAVAVGAVGLAPGALATPPSAAGLHFVNYTLVIDPDAVDRVQLNLPGAADYEEDAPITHRTRSPAVFVFQDFTLLPEGNTGWHYHPGKVLITIAKGSVEWYDSKCQRQVRSEGDFFTETDQVHFLRNSSSEPARLFLTFIISKGLTNKIYADAPPCAKALGLR